MFESENEGFGNVMKSIFDCIAQVTESKNDKIRLQNANSQVKE